MLPPDQRELLTDLLRPEPGYTLERAIGTTFTLDLDSLMQVPVAFLQQSGLLRGEDDKLDPLAALEALRRCSGKLTVFAEAGYIKMPKDLPRLAALLEPCVCEVKAPREAGLFHPKVWVLRFERNTPDEGDARVRYRVLCLSRNLTFDRSWDTAVSLDGVLREDRTKGFSNTRNLAEFVARLPELALRRLDAGRADQIASMAEELRLVEFEVPEGFDELAFHHGGLGGSNAPIFPERRERMLIVSPFISGSFLSRFTSGSEVTVVSRFEELNRTPHDALQGCQRLFVMSRRAVSDDAGDVSETEPELDGLHAKLFVFDKGWYSHLFSGSFNATNAAFERNVEFMVELRGMKSRHGVLAMVPEVAGQRKDGKASPCLGDLLEVYHIPAEEEPADDADERWEAACHAVRLAVSEAALELHLAAEEGSYVFTLQGRLKLAWHEGMHLWAWPAAVSGTNACELDDSGCWELGRFTDEAITAWVAFELRQGKGEGSRRSSWLMKAALSGAPADREQRVLASLIRSREELIRFLLLMLSLDDQGPGGRAEEDIAEFLAGRARGAHAMMPPLLETLLRAAHYSPQTLHRIAGLMQDLRATPEGARLEDQALQALWEPVWRAVERHHHEKA